MTMNMGKSCDDSFKRPGSVPFKWESQPGVPKHTANPLAGAPAAPLSRPKLQPPPSRARRHHQHHPRSASASPTRCRTSFASTTAAPSASPSPSWKRPTVAVVSHGCFPAASPLKRRDGSKSKGSPEAAPPRRPGSARSFSAFSAPLGRSSPPAAEVETRRRSLALSEPLGRPTRAAEEGWDRRDSPAFLSPLGRYHRAAEEDWARQGSPAFLSPRGGSHRAAEEAVSATRWLF